MRSKEDFKNAVSPTIGVILMVAVVVVLGIMISQLGFEVTDIIGGENPDAAVYVDENINDTLTGERGEDWYDVTITYGKEVNSDKVLVRDADFGAGANLSRPGNVATLTKKKGESVVVIAVKNGERRVLFNHRVGD